VLVIQPAVAFVVVISLVCLYTYNTVC